MSTEEPDAEAPTCFTFWAIAAPKLLFESPKPILFTRNFFHVLFAGYLCSSVNEQSGRVGMLVYRPDDKVSRSAIHEAVEAFLSRSQADLGQALPLHVEESLTYLQDHLLDVCQC